MNQDNCINNLLAEGYLHLERGQYEKALAVFQQLNELDRDNPEIKNALGLTYFRQEKYQKSIECLDLALQLKPNYLSALVRRGMAYKYSGQTDLGNVDFESVLQIKPKTYKDWRARGVAFDELKQPELALKCYDRVLEIKPDDYLSLFNKGLTLQNLKQYELALQCYDLSLSICPDRLFTISNRAYTLFILQRYQDAVNAYEKAIKLNPNDCYCWIDRGISLSCLGKFVEAIRSYDRAIEIDEHNCLAWYYRGLASIEIQKFEIALLCFDRSQNIDPEFRKAKERKICLLIKMSHPSLVDTQFDFILKILRYLDFGGSPYNLFNFLEIMSNPHLLEVPFTKILEIWASETIHRLKPEQKQIVGNALSDFCTLISDIPFGNKIQNIEAGIVGYKILLNIFTENDFPKEWASTQLNLGVSYVVKTTGDKKHNIENSIDYLNTALKVFTKENFPQEWGSVQYNLAQAFGDRILEDRKQNIEKSIYHLKAALEVRDKITCSEKFAATHNNLGSSYWARIAGDRKQNIEDAIHHYHIALKVWEENQDIFHQRITLANLGNTCLIRIAGDRKQNIEDAISYYEVALQTFEPLNELNPRLIANTQNNLGCAYIERIVRDEKDNIEFAIHCFKEVLKFRSEKGDHPYEWGQTQNNLGYAYWKRNVGDRSENIEKSIALYKAALKVFTKNIYPDVWSNTKTNLGLAYVDRVLGSRKENINEAISFYQSALSVLNIQSNPLFYFRTSMCLGNIAFQEEKWNLAINAYAGAIKATETSRSWSIDDNRRQEIIIEAIKAYENIVQAFINNKQIETAIEYAERSRCRRLVDLMMSNNFYSDEDILPEVLELLKVYKSIQEKIKEERSKQDNNTNRSANNSRSGILITNASYQIKKEIFKPFNANDVDYKFTREKFEAFNNLIESLEVKKQEVWQEIRKFDPVLSEQIQVQPISFYTIRQLIPDYRSAIVYFYTTSLNLNIFIIYKNRPAQNYVTNFSRQQLILFSKKDWFIPYFNWLEYQQWLQVDSEKRKPLNIANTEAWYEEMYPALTKLSNNLNLSIIADKYLQDIDELIIVPHLYLHSIPFSALPISSLEKEETEKIKSSQKLLGERFSIRTLPSAQVLQFCHIENSGSANTNNYGIVEDADNSLPFSQYEGEQIAQIFDIPDDNRLRGKTQATVKEYRKLAGRVQVLHSSHHASFRLDKPLESHLVLADGTIDLGSIMSPGWRLPNLEDVFLSCCETNLGDANLTDDPLTIATGFLCAGAKSVVSTLWEVDDLATAIFSIIYYQLRNDGLDRPTALQQAQLRLRTMTGTELNSLYETTLGEYLKTKRNEADNNRRKTTRNKKYWRAVANNYNQRLKYVKQLTEQTYPFSHPYYWAGFITQGLR